MELSVIVRKAQNGLSNPKRIEMKMILTAGQAVAKC